LIKRVSPLSRRRPPRARRRKLIKKKRKQKTAQKLTAKPDFRPRPTGPLPPGAEIERRLRALLTPGLFAPRRRAAGPVKRRDRRLPLPVMAVLVVSLVWRQMPSVSEAWRVVAREGLGEGAPCVVSRQALAQRLRALPAQLFAQLYADALGRIRAVRPSAPVAPGTLQARFTALGAADGSTVEARRRKLKDRRESQTPLGGKMLAVVDLWTHRPQQTWDTAQPQAKDKTFCAQLGAALPVGGLVVVDLGWFSFPCFDALTAAGKYFVTRLRERTASRVVAVLGASAH
jgi:hypothetical protein